MCQYVKSARIRSISGPYSAKMRENIDKQNTENTSSKYEHFLDSVFCKKTLLDLLQFIPIFTFYSFKLLEFLLRMWVRVGTHRKVKS